MNIIAQNPYRVLGMFANDSKSVMKANISRIRAYSLVDDHLKFPCDHEEIFGPVDRSEKAVQEAVAQLSDPISAKTWQFFWIHSTDEGKEKIDTASTSTASDINRAVLAIAEKSGDEELAATAYARVFEKRRQDITLFDNATFWNDEQEKEPVAKEFVDKLDSLIPAHELLYGAKRYNGWFWWFRSKLEEGNVLRNAVEDKYKNFAIEGLETINSDRIGVAPHYRKYRKLLWLARPYLDILGTFSSADDGQVPEDILLVRDKLARTLINFCYQVFEKNTYWFAADVEDMCEFLSKDVSPLAYLGSTKDLLVGKCDELKEKSLLLAPDECKPQADSIRKLIKEFRKKRGGVQLSFALLRDAEEPLSQIREKLGTKNLFFRHISTTVADNAIHSAEKELSAAEREHGNAANGNDSAADIIDGIVEQCRELASAMESLDLEDDFVAGKLRSFAEHIDRIGDFQSDADDVVLDENPESEMYVEESADIDVESADIDVESADIDVEPAAEAVAVAAEVESTVDDAPTEADEKEALVEETSDEEEKVFADAKKTNNYTGYLKQYPDGRYVKMAERQMEYEFYQRVLRSRSFAEYYNLYPDGEYTQLVRDAEEKDRLNRCKTNEDFVQYLADYPNGKYKAIAEDEINRYQRKHLTVKLAIILAAALVIGCALLIFG